MTIRPSLDDTGSIERLLILVPRSNPSEFESGLCEIARRGSDVIARVARSDLGSVGTWTCSTVKLLVAFHGSGEPWHFDSANPDYVSFETLDSDIVISQYELKDEIKNRLNVLLANKDAPGGAQEYSTLREAPSALSNVEHQHANSWTEAFSLLWTFLERSALKRERRQEVWRTHWMDFRSRTRKELDGQSADP